MPSALEDFLVQFGETELPALYSTVRGISMITEDSDVPIEKLADMIRTDASMTAHILRHTQGAYRIPLKGKHNTINRAIVMLGFREVKALCLTLSVLKGLSSENATDAYMGELATIFHGAIQARSIALLRGERACEEVFTTALLSRIGHLMFWASSDSRIEILNNAYKGRPTEQYSNIENAVLGFTLSDLSKHVIGSWGLKEYSRSPSANLVTTGEEIRFDATDLGMEIADSAAQGWENDNMKGVMQRVSAYLDLSEDVVRGTLIENAVIGSQVCENFNMPEVAQAIGDTLTINKAYEDGVLDEDFSEAEGEPAFDPAFLLKVLSEIGNSLESGVDINKIIGMTLEGVYKGVGFDRVLFALLTPNRKQLRGKAGLGRSHKKALDNFKVDIEDNLPSVFTRCMKEGESVWLTEGLSKEPNIPELFKNCLPGAECIVVPLVVSGRSIGVFYADKGNNEKKISSNDFGSLKQFVFQIQLALEHMQKGTKVCGTKSAKEIEIKL